MREIYLDNAATTRVHEAVARDMLETLTEDYGNPSSLHRKGLSAQLRFERAKKSVLRLLGDEEGELIFTSGGTEANNMALFGAAGANAHRGKGVLTTAFEHASVGEALTELGRRGFVADFVPVPGGVVDVGRVLGMVTPETVLVSVMLVNNELGSVAPIAELSRALRREHPRIVLHCDAVQAFGKLPLSVRELGVDLMTISAHKIHGPKGVGALYIRKGVKLRPLLFGGEQQGRLRPGTEPLPAISGFGTAAALAAKDLPEDLRRISALCAELEARVRAIPGVVINSPEGHSPYLLNLSLPGYPSEVLLHALEEDGIYVSSGSACAMGKPSHALEAARLPRECLMSALRISLSRHTEAEELAFFAQSLARLPQRLHRA